TSYGNSLKRSLCSLAHDLGGSIDATSLTAAATDAPSVGSARPSVSWYLDISCSVGQSRSMPSGAQSDTNRARSGGRAGQSGAPLSSHHLAYSGAVRARAWASAASTGLVDRIDAYRFALRSASWTPPIFLRNSINCTRRRRLCGLESISPCSS